jgi:hypothetical protein
MLALGFVAGGGGAVATVAAPRPLPDLTPEEIQLRAWVEPLRDGVTEGAELQPLRDWLDTRAAAGEGREAERELRRVLKRIHDEQNKDLLRAAQWVRVLQIQRSKLYAQLSDDTIRLKRAVEQSQDLGPLPLLEELLPGRAEISDAFLGNDLGAPPEAMGQDAAVEEAGPETEEATTTDLDAPRLLDRLTLDLTALQHLLHECDNEYERERERHRTALDALTTFLQARRTAANTPSPKEPPPP